MRKVDGTNESGYVNPACAAEIVDGKQILEQSLSDFLSVETISEHPIGIRDREDGQAVRQVVIPNHGFQGIWSVVISVSSDEHELLTLACSPDHCVRRIVGQRQGGKACDKRSEVIQRSRQVSEAQTEMMALTCFPALMSARMPRIAGLPSLCLALLSDRGKKSLMTCVELGLDFRWIAAIDAFHDLVVSRHHFVSDYGHQDLRNQREDRVSVSRALLRSRTVRRRIRRFALRE
jgi:hypothetical protein